MSQDLSAALFKAYTPLLDEAYKLASLSAKLDTASELQGRDVTVRGASYGVPWRAAVSVRLACLGGAAPSNVFDVKPLPIPRSVADKAGPAIAGRHPAPVLTPGGVHRGAARGVQPKLPDGERARRAARSGDGHRA